MNNALSRVNNSTTLKNRSAFNEIGAVGAVTEGQMMPSSTPFPEFIGFDLDNSAGATEVTYSLYDALGAVGSLLGGSMLEADSTTAPSVVIAKEAVKQNPLRFSGFGYRVTTGTSAQLSKSFKFHKATIDSTLVSKPVFLQRGIRNNQYQDKIVHIHQQFVVDQYSAFTITVAAGTAVSIDFWIDAQFNVL